MFTGSGSSDGGGEGDVPYLPNGGIEGMALEDKTVMEDPANSGEELAGGEGEESASEQQQQHADQEGDKSNVFTCYLMQLVSLIA